MVFDEVSCPESTGCVNFCVGHLSKSSKAETVDEDIGHERMPTTPTPADRQRSQRSSAPSAVRFMKRCRAPPLENGCKSSSWNIAKEVIFSNWVVATQIFLEFSPRFLGKMNPF